MVFNDATISYHSSLTASCRQFRIRTENAVHMTVLGPSGYTYLKLNAEQTQTVNALAKKVGIEHENGPKGNTFMVYSGTFLPGQKVVDSSCDATLDEKKVFGQIFEIAAASIATQMGLSVNPGDVTSIELEKTVDFSSIEARACGLNFQLSQSAADRLSIDKDIRFHEYGSHDTDKVIPLQTRRRFPGM